jgi:hypothetical protein
MIWLSSDYLLFQMPSGESIPFSSEAIAVEFVDEAEGEIDAELVRQAAMAVYFYFKHELQRDTVTVTEFSGAMEKVLDGFEIAIVPNPAQGADRRLVETDLGALAKCSGREFELGFFPRLRDELRGHLQTSPEVVRFRGLRECVKHLAGAKRWSPRCRELEDQIIRFMRECLGAEARNARCTLVLD